MPVLAPSAIQAGVGLFQGIKGLFGANKAQKALEKLQAPTYTPNQAIGSYYNNALARYNANPYDTQAYGMAKNNAMAGTAAGLNALQGRRSALAGVGKLVGIQDNALQKAAVSAEDQRNREFSQLGTATNMKAADDRTAFQYNQMMPYENKRQLLGAKASGYNRMLSSGIQNLFGGVGNFAKLKAFAPKSGAQQTQFDQGLGTYGW